MGAGQVFARMRDCTCPGKPHADEGDGVWLHEKVSLEGGLALQTSLSSAVEGIDPTDKGAQAALTVAISSRWLAMLVRYEAAGWNLTDGRGRPVPFDVEELLGDYNLALPVADKAAELYTTSVLVPLAQRLSGLLRIGSPDDSTSPRARSTRKSSRRSSRASTADTKRSAG